jgi:hypothetical protein
MTHILSRVLDELVGPKAPVLEAFFRHLDRIGTGALVDIETTLKCIDIDTWNESAVEVQTDALHVIDPIATAVVKALVRQYDDGNWSVQFLRGLTNACYEILLSEWAMSNGYWMRQFKFIPLTEVAHG